MLSFGKDSKVWVENIAAKEYKEEKEEPYFLGSVVNFDQKTSLTEVKYISIKKNNEKVKFERMVPFINELSINVNDMASVEDINEIDLLNNLKNRFNNKNIFTNVGPTLIIINPYQMVDGAFSQGKMDGFIKFHNSVKVAQERKIIEEPHLYDITMIAIRRLIELKKNQAIIISGESGAGKTETAKNAMECITYFFGKTSKTQKEPSLEHKILSCNPILEAFGNAKTVRNDNSSRFGKYVTINLDLTSGKIEGAQIETYLLEKSRICEPSEGERNYHIFYHLLKAEEKLLKNLHLSSDPANYKILAASKCFVVDTINDEKLFKETEEAFKITGFSEVEVMAIFKIVASCLLLGNVTFKEVGGDKTIVEDKGGLFTSACELLEINCDVLESALTHNVRMIQGNFLKSPLKIYDSYIYKNSFTKELYSRLFNWIVKKLNNMLYKPINNNNADQKYIGLLDIFGFECFGFNSLEQMCINFTNEKLQQIFINDVFKSELNEYIKEGLHDSLGLIKFNDNQGIIDLIDKAPLGLFQLIDETCMTNTDDKNYLAKITKAHSANPSFKIPKLSKNVYAIVHTAKTVEYTVTGYVSKNIDEVKITMVECMEQSKNIMINYIFMNCLNEDEYKEEVLRIAEERKNRNKKISDKKYLCSKFKKEMETLMAKLANCECNYIRCLKPNELKKKEFFIPTFVFQQIKYLGVLDTIKIRKDGFPSRRTFKDFLIKFEQICYWNSKKSSEYYINLQDDKEIKELAIKCLEIMYPKYSQKEVLIGINRIMMKSAFYLKLDREFEEKIMKRKWSCLKIVKMWKGSKLRRRYIKTRKQTVLLQRWYRKQKFTRKIKKMRQSSKLIQSTYKALQMYRTIKFMRICVIKLQANILMFMARINLEKRRKAGEKININMKIFLTRSRIKRKRKIKLLVYSIFEKSWFFVVCKMKFFAAIRIQMNVRALLVKEKHWDIVCRGRDKRKWFIEDRASNTIQRFYRGFRIRIAVKLAHAAGNKIQSYWRMTKIKEIMIQMRNNAILIQNCIKTHISRQKALNKRLAEFFNEEQNYINNNYIECDKFLFPNKQKTMIVKNIKSKEIIFEPFKNVSTQQNLKKAILPKQIVLNDPKIILFAKVLDLDFNIDSYEIYDKNWASEFELIYNHNIQNGSPIQQISIGSCHTILLNNKGKIYSWGWNNYGQCCISSKYTLNNVIVPRIYKDIRGNIPSVPLVNYLDAKSKPMQLDKLTEIKQVICYDDYTFLIDDTSTLYGCGNNSKGQLGLGNMWEVEGPTLISSEFKGKIKKVASTGDVNIAITSNGNMYAWAITSYQAFKPIRYNFKSLVTISTVSCGAGFAILLSTQGSLFSFGTSNHFGQLGTGDFNPRPHPEMIITNVEHDKIVQISCGYKHTIAKGSSGRVYSWGLNSSGQLGIGSYKDSNFPVIIYLDNLFPYRVKIVQVASSFRASYFLTEQRLILCCGTNGEFNKLKVINKLNLKTKTPEISDENSYTPLKICCTWTKSLSIFYSVFGDITEINSKMTSRQKVNMVLNTIASKWDTDTNEPPYIESFSGYFPSTTMKKTQEKKITRKMSYVDELKHLVKK